MTSCSCSSWMCEENLLRIVWPTTPRHIKTEANCASNCSLFPLWNFPRATPSLWGMMQRETFFSFVQIRSHCGLRILGEGLEGHFEWVGSNILFIKSLHKLIVFCLGSESILQRRPMGTVRNLWGSSRWCFLWPYGTKTPDSWGSRAHLVAGYVMCCIVTASVCNNTDTPCPAHIHSPSKKRPQQQTRPWGAQTKSVYTTPDQARP